MSPAIRSLILAIMNTAMAHNDRDAGPTIFCEFSGHMECIDVRVFFSGWRLGRTDDWRKSVYTADSSSAAAELVNLHSELRALIDSRAGVHALPQFAEVAHA